jgi:hypothetical protein
MNVDMYLRVRYEVSVLHRSVLHRSLKRKAKVYELAKKKRKRVKLTISFKRVLPSLVSLISPEPPTSLIQRTTKKKIVRLINKQKNENGEIRKCTF